MRPSKTPLMEAIVPLISTSKTGPSGIMHLPRLWMKILLASKGRLAEGYRHGIGGFDERLLENFGVDRDAFIRYVESEQPDYLAAERWFTEHATAFSPQTVAASNAGFLEASFSDPARSKMLSRARGPRRRSVHERDPAQRSRRLVRLSRVARRRSRLARTTCSKTSGSSIVSAFRSRTST